MRVILIIAACLIGMMCPGADPPAIDRAPAARPADWARRGRTLNLTQDEIPFTLYLPNDTTNNPATVITVHFHSAPSFTIPEHLRRGASNPIAVFMLGSGSAAYAKPFANPAVFGGILRRIERELGFGKPGGAVRLTGLEISSFSAGYGAVRELLKTKEYFDLIQSIVLLDSFYGGLEPQTGGSNRIVQRDHVEAWVPFARKAITGQKRFLITTSQIHTPGYAATYEVAAALIERLGLRAEILGTNNASAKITLLRRADAGLLHVWSYSGTNGPAHTAHIQHMADFWSF